MIVAHMPEDGSGANAYGRLLRDAFGRQGVQTVPLPASTFFIRDVLANRADVIQFEFIDAFFLPHKLRPAWFFGTIKALLFIAQLMILRLRGVRLVTAARTRDWSRPCTGAGFALWPPWWKPVPPARRRQRQCPNRKSAFAAAPMAPALPLPSPDPGRP